MYESEYWFEVKRRKQNGKEKNVIERLLKYQKN